MTQIDAELVIGGVTFFVTAIVNAVIIGMFVGGIRAEVRTISDRLARLEGVFTLVPRSIKGGDGDG